MRGKSAREKRRTKPIAIAKGIKIRNIHGHERRQVAVWMSMSVVASGGTNVMGTESWGMSMGARRVRGWGYEVGEAAVEVRPCNSELRRGRTCVFAKPYSEMARWIMLLTTLRVRRLHRQPGGLRPGSPRCAHSEGSACAEEVHSEGSACAEEVHSEGSACGRKCIRRGSACASSGMRREGGTGVDVDEDARRRGQP